MTKPTKLEIEIEDILLEFAALWDQIDYSDLQGTAMVKARDIIDLVRKENND